MKKALALLLVLMMLVSMTACGSSGKTEAPKTETEAPKTETTAAEGGEEAPAASGTITVATTMMDEKLECMKEVYAAFEAETGIHVELIAPGNDYESQLKTMMASNSLPDVFETHGWSLIRYSEYLKPVNDQPWFDTMDLDSVGGVCADENGKIYALVQTISVSGICYNKDTLDAVGIDPTKIVTWADWEAAADKLVAAGYVPLVIGGSVSGNAAGMLGSVAPTFWTDEGAKYDLAAELQGGTFDFDTYGTELYNMFLDWWNKGYVNEDVLTLDGPGAQQMLGSGEAAFMVRGADNIATARYYYPEANMGIIPMCASADGAPSFRIGEGMAYGVWKDTKNEAACWALLEYLARPEVAGKIADVTGGLPAIKGASTGDTYVAECYAKAVADCNGFVQYDNVFDRKYFPSGMWGIMGGSIQMLLDDGNVKAAVDYLAENYQNLYEQAHS